MQLTNFELYVILSAFTYVAIIMIIVLGAVSKINSLKKQLREKLSEDCIPTITFLLNRMKEELTPADMKLLVDRANQIPAILLQGEFSYIPGLQKIIFTKIPLQ